MTWRAAFWWGLVIIGFVTILIELASNTAGPIVIATGMILVAIGVGFAKVDSYVCGIGRFARAHLGADLQKLTEISKSVPQREWFNVCQALQHLTDQQGSVGPFGVPSWVAYDDDVEEDMTPANGSVGLDALLRENSRRESLKYQTLTMSSSRSLRVPTNAVYLLAAPGHHQPIPFAASLRGGQLAVVARSEEDAHQALLLIERKAQADSVYRGHVLTLKAKPKRGYRIEFAEPASVTRDQIILPPQVMDVLDRNILQVIGRAQELQQAGRSLQHGVLLYGPPGTGKSLAVRYLISAAKTVTVVNVTGRQLRLVRECCRLARLLAPSIVVLEDVDLIATDRAQSRRTMLLHDLLDEMDVRSSELPVVFLMTTNRPDVIEGALSLRPGRINQAIHFPLPDDDCRLRLLQHFLQGVNAASLDLAVLVARSQGASAAFIEEWIRRATLFAIGRQAAKTEQVSLTMADFDSAIHEIVEDGGSLTRKLLGHAVPTR